jgi:1-acyl-sn-glycerol-3-phosphate acyltransferase
VKNAPSEPPFLLVSNHLSYIDVFVLFSQLRCLFVAKSDVKSWPFIGFIARTCGILFIDRDRKRDVTRVNKLISSNINQNQGIILFPEGTTSPGFDILPFKSSLLEFPAREGLEASYAAISYQTSEGEKPAYQSICWWEDIPFFVHFFNLLKLKEFTAIINFGDERIVDADRKSLALRLKKSMGNEFEVVIPEEEFHKKHSKFVPALS